MSATACEDSRATPGARRARRALVAVALCVLAALAGLRAWAAPPPPTPSAADALARAEALTASGAPWEALAVLRAIDGSAADDGAVSAARAHLLESLGAFTQARAVVDRQILRLGEAAPFALKSWSRHLEYRYQQSATTREREAALVQVAVGLIDLDPTQSYTMLQELAGSIGRLDEAPAQQLILQMEVLGFSDLAELLAHRRLLLAATPDDEARARLRVEAIRARAARAALAQGRVSLPGGELRLGTTRRAWRQNGRRDIDRDERPAHKVRLGPYVLGSHEVTVQAYRRCQILGGCPPPRIPVTTRDPLQAMTGISWEAAGAYCRFAGGRLPTEAEWEAAAVGPEGRIYPWGDEAPSCRRAHFLGCELVDGVETFRREAVPVGTHGDGATPEGIQDLAGNVSEWVADGYDPEGYADLDRDDPRGPEDADRRVTRGGSFDRKAFELRGARREARVPSQGYAEVGIRCAFDTPSLAP